MIMAFKAPSFLCFLLCCLWGNSAAHPILPPELVTLETSVNNYLYNTKFDSAQASIFQYLKQRNLSLLEKTYGYYLTANVRRASGTPEEAIKILHTLQENIDQLPQNTQTPFQTLFWGKLAECYFDKQKFDTACTIAQHSVTLAPNNPLRSNGHAINYIILGACAVNEEDFVKATYYYQMAIQQYQIEGDVCELPLCYIKTAHLKMRQDNHTGAMQDLERALFLSDSCDIDQYRFISHGALIEYYKYIGDHKKAVEEYEVFINLSKLIYQEKQQNHLNALQVDFETELAQAENEQLLQDARFQQQEASTRALTLLVLVLVLAFSLFFVGWVLRLRQRQNLQLAAQLKQIQDQKQERDALLKEVHHRVKNNLQVITSLLHLQASQQQPVLVGAPDSDLFRSSQDRINAMALVHELLYQSNTLATIPLRQYVRRLFDALMKSHHKPNCPVDLNLDLPDLELDLDTATPLGLLFNEVLTNSLVHGFSHVGSGEFYIRAEHLKDNSYAFFMGDNGKGCNKDINFSQQKTLGFSLMRKLARQLQGSIEHLVQEEGCHYKLTLRLPPPARAKWSTHGH